MISVQHLKKKYGQLAVLKDVTFEIKEGEFITIVGPSGAGKSTLMHILSALDTQDEGQVWIKGQQLSALKGNKLAQFRNQQFGFIFQFHHLLPEFTALENVMIPLFINNIGRKEATLRATTILQKVGLAQRLQHKPGELSGGEQQRVAIARAIVNHPAIIFADEPTGNLDSVNADSVHALFLQLQKEMQLTFVIVTHNERLAKLGNRVFHMRDGIIEKIEEA